LTERTERFSHRDTETQGKVDLCVFVSPWLILSELSTVSVSEMDR